MERALLIDIGSTYTKASLVDLEEISLLDRAQSFTTIDIGVNIGLNRALKQIEGWQDAKYKLACSSAAGGLKIIAIGLVPQLTAEAAKRAALGAGSKVLHTYSYQLTGQDVEEIVNKNPDLILLAGGTDGGNRENILHNTQVIAASSLQQPIVAAGNRAVSREVEEILEEAGKEVHLTENVMPELEKLNIEPARETIRNIFLKKIIEAKGLSDVDSIIDGIIMPTPSAVLSASRILAEGCGDEAGLGDLIVVDVGGATTDVHSIASGEPSKANVNWKGLEEPFVKRTVEGDLGMRYSLPTLYEAISESSLKRQLANPEVGGLSKIGEERKLKDLSIEDCSELVNRLHLKKEIFTEGRGVIIERVLAYHAVRLAVARHVGVINTIFTPMGAVAVQEGKDLTVIRYLIGTGGVLVNNAEPGYILSGALYKNQEDAQLLAPQSPEFLIDKEYILAAAGLLAEVEPEKSLKFMKKYLVKA
jgi:uncharacterized protein (TIGR01319 family)